MATFTAIRLDDAEPAVRPPGHEVAGRCEARRLNPLGFSLWLIDAHWAEAGTIRWGPDHGDEAIHVLEGELEIAGRICPTGGAVIVESGAVAEAEVRTGTRVAHFGAAAPSPPAHGPLGPPAPDGHGTHVVGPAGRWRSGRREGVKATWFADSTCPTCRAAFFLVEAEGRHDGPAHTHSQDEIILVLAGTIRMGARTFGPGTSLCIPRRLRYAFRGHDAGHRFLNFRADASYQTNAGAEPLLETPTARGGEFVGDLR